MYIIDTTCPGLSLPLDTPLKKHFSMKRDREQAFGEERGREQAFCVDLADMLSKFEALSAVIKEEIPEVLTARVNVPETFAVNTKKPRA